MAISDELRAAFSNAEEKEVVSKEEIGFIVTLVERFRMDIERKTRQLHTLGGEIAQLKINEKIIIDTLNNLISAAEREKAREEAAAKLRGEDIEDNEE